MPRNLESSHLTVTINMRAERHQDARRQGSAFPHGTEFMESGTPGSPLAGENSGTAAGSPPGIQTQAPQPDA